MKRLRLGHGANRSLEAHFTPWYTIVATPGVLWPANRKMVPVVLSVLSVDSSVRGKIVSVSMNEPADRRTPDWGITGDLTLRLRAERAKDGPGRVYTITVECRDAWGHASTGTKNILVPGERPERSSLTGLQRYRR